VRLAVGVMSVLFLTACGTGKSEAAAEPASTSDVSRISRQVRLTGIVEAVHSSKIVVPQIAGQGGRLTLTRLIANGTKVQQGDVIAEFDPTQQLEAAFTARAKYDDLGHQVNQKASQNRADAEKRRADLIQAQADLSKAMLEIQKAPILSEVDRLKNEEKAAVARQHVESLTKSNAFHDAADAAALRILELQRDRQKVALERAQANINRLQVRASLAGMIAHQNVYRGNSNGKAQEGDQLFAGQALVSIFNPTEMRVRCLVGEPDGARLKPSARVTIYLDAYPEIALPGHFESASPIASSALGSPIKTFTAIFKLDTTDPHLMPDLSAAVVIDAENSGATQ
jgi:multidrug resistance efflux pump